MRQVIRTAASYDLVIWNDAAHSLEKNNVSDVVRTLTSTAEEFKRSGIKHLFRLHNYVHALGPLGIKPGESFYHSSIFLQVPRINLLNRGTRELMENLQIPVYDSSIVHAARPDATSDKLHWAPVEKSCNDSDYRCEAFCEGKWADMGKLLCERRLPVLSFWSMQIALSTIINQLVSS